jgi:hypothetical protein
MMNDSTAGGASLRQVRLGKNIRNGHNEDAGEFGLQAGLTDIFDVAVILEKNAGNGGNDARAVLA